MANLKSISLESEAGFRALFRYATIGILVISESGRIELVNHSAETLFGYSDTELIGQPVEVLIPEALRPGHQDHRAEYFKRPKGRPMGYGLDLRARRKDGTEFPVEISLGHYHLDGEKLAVAFVTDITRQKEYEEELERKVEDRTKQLAVALEREKELSELKSRFVSIASHEFRTPLTTILSSLSLVEAYSGEEQATKRKKHIERIQSSVRNLTEILNDFLSLDKLEQEKVEIVLQNFDLPEFLKNVAEETEGMLKEGQEIIISCTGKKEVLLDKKILNNVLLNLFSNAIKYSGENKKISLNCEADNNAVEIRVQDEGIGIPEEEQKDLFGKFFRAKNAVNIQGTGLGLIITKRYIELLGGTIRFTSSLNKGTTFVVRFPQNI